MTTRNRTWLDNFFGPWILRLSGVDYPERPTVEIIASTGIAISAEDDAATDATKVTFSAGTTSTAITKSDDTDLTLSANQCAHSIIDVSGTPGGPFNLLAPDTTNTRFWLVNGTDQNATVKKAGGVGVTIAANCAAQVRHNGTDYTRMTLDADQS